MANPPIPVTFSLPSIVFNGSSSLDINGVMVSFGSINLAPGMWIMRSVETNSDAAKGEEKHEYNAGKLQNVGVLQHTLKFELQGRTHWLYGPLDGYLQPYLEELPRKDFCFELLGVAKDLIVSLRDSHDKGVHHDNISLHDLVVSADKSVKIMCFDDWGWDRTNASFNNDYVALVEIFRTHIQSKIANGKVQKKSRFAIEYNKFLDDISGVHDPNELMHLHIHPIFLTDLERMYYYLCFESRLNFMGDTILVRLPLLKKEFYDSLDTIKYPADIEGYDTWPEKACLVHPEFQRIFYYVEGGYSPGARSFIRFCKNVSIHATGELQEDMPRTARLLLSVWRDFPFDIHRRMVKNCYYNIRAR